MSKCVYAVTVNGKEVLVEAGNQAQAIRTATKPLVSGCVALSGHQVFERIKAGGEVLTGETETAQAEAEGSKSEPEPSK